MFINDGWLVVSSFKQMVELELDGDGDSRRSSIKSSVVTSVGGMCPLCPKMICVALSMVSAFNICVLLNGIECARCALILNSGGGVQVSGSEIVMMVFWSFCIISVFLNLVSWIPCMFIVCLLRTSRLLSVLLHIEHWYFVAVGPWIFFMCLARLWLFLSVLWHISHLITVFFIITVLNSILQVREFAIALSKPPLFSGECLLSVMGLL